MPRLVMGRLYASRIIRRYRRKKIDKGRIIIVPEAGAQSQAKTREGRTGLFCNLQSGTVSSQYFTNITRMPVTVTV